MQGTFLHFFTIMVDLKTKILYIIYVSWKKGVNDMQNETATH